jgi:hypothetical protein
VDEDLVGARPAGVVWQGTWFRRPSTVGKQVTLDVFRQLQDAVLINHDGSLAGPPWGMVNYHQKS